MSTILNRLERARSSKRITVVSIIGLILVPLVIAGGLVWALWNPSERLGQVTAAIVNNDEPVTIDGQTVPLGRQLAAGLAAGDQETNYTWVITDASDAKSGLADGSYTAVVTIPANFSAAATSFSGEAADAQRARLDVTTSDRSKLVDDAITQTITQTASTLLGRQLTTTYLENVYVGFNTLHDQLGEAADGASQLSTGGLSLAQGAQDLANGTTQLADGAVSLADGATQLSDGSGQLSSGLAALYAGTQPGGSSPGLVAGAEGLSTGAAKVSSGLADLSAGAKGTAGVTSALAGQLAQLAAECAASGASDTYCAGVAQAAGFSAGIVSGMPVPGGTYPGTTVLADGTEAAADGAAELATGAATFSAGMPTLVDGIATITSAASQLATGAAALADGATQASTGTAQVADGATQLSAGAGTLSGGITSLASGLQSAVDSLPTYTSADRRTLADVVADPVSAGDSSSVAFGTNSAPFYAVLALWLGALASFLVLRPVPVRAFGSTRSSLRLALGSFAPAGAVGMAQGALVAVITAPLLDLDAAAWLGFAGIAVLAGAVFAATNQALVALLGGAGRFISMIVALVGLATGIIATTPPVLDQVLAFLPIAPALSGLQSIAIGDTGAAAAVVGLVVWLLGSIAATTFAVARARTTTVKALTPALA
ncbi:YhgE/Pip domain-containing protein [Plantibacter flavus]|uniref:YhgE/Pip family protein n=1 Tax=Plantibacter flavus TaxID=150123 RepID=UPI003F17CB3B